MGWLETMLAKLQEVFRHQRNKYQVYDRFVAEFAKGFYDEHKKLYATDRIDYLSQFKRMQEAEWQKFWYKLKEAKEE